MISCSSRYRKEFCQGLEVDVSAFANSETTKDGKALWFLEDGEPLGFIPHNKQITTYGSQPFSNRWPSSLAGIVGNKEVLTSLAEPLITNVIPRPIVLYGSRGTGKTSVAQIYAAKCLCCYFEFNSCFFSACKDCERYFHSTHFTNVDCASLEIPEIKRRITRRYPNILTFGSRTVIFIDEMNYDKAEIISRHLTRVVEEIDNLVVLICCNEGIGQLDFGLTTRAIKFKFNEPEVVELTSWLYKYAASENIHISLFNAFTIVKCIQPERIPRDALKHLQRLFGIKASSYNDRLVKLFSLEEGDIEKLKDDFSEQEADCQKELENWE